MPCSLIAKQLFLQAPGTWSPPEASAHLREPIGAIAWAGVHLGYLNPPSMFGSQTLLVLLDFYANLTICSAKYPQFSYLATFARRCCNVLQSLKLIDKFDNFDLSNVEPKLPTLCVTPSNGSALLLK